MTYDVELDGHTASVDVSQHPDGGWWIAVDGAERVHWTGSQLGAAEWMLRGPDGSHRVGVYVDGDRVALQLAGQGLLGTIVDPRDHALEAAGGAGEGAICTPMPGLVVRVPVGIGDTVAAGEVVIVVEAMKMENEYKTMVAGTVTEVHVAAGATVDAGALLITVEPE